MEQEQTKVGFFKKVWKSITKIEKYPEMAADGVPKAIGYLAKLVLILSAVLCLGTIYQIHSLVKDGVDYLQNDFPDIAYSDGKLDVKSENEIIIPAENSVLGKTIINTKDIDEAKQNEYINNIKSDGGNGLIVLNDKAILISEGLSDNVEYRFKDIATALNVSNFTKQDLVNFVNSSKILTVYLSLFIVLMIYAFVIYMISKLIDVLMLSVFGFIASMLAKIKMRYAGIFNMSVYALTLSIILDTVYIIVNIFVPFTIKYFQVMYVGVAAIYLVAAILMLKTDVREQMMAVAEIEKTQEEVREQLREEEEEKKKNEEEKKERQKKDKDKEEKDKKDMPDDPAGSNA